MKRSTKHEQTNVCTRCGHSIKSHDDATWVCTVRNCSCTMYQIPMCDVIDEHPPKKRGVGRLPVMQLSFDWPDSVPHTEMSVEFIQGMLNRLAQAYFVYGPMADGFPDKVDAMSSCGTRLWQYMVSGNVEWLIDAANFLLIEYKHPHHSRAHKRAIRAAESPGRVWHQSTGEDAPEVTRRANDRSPLYVQEEAERKSSSTGGQGRTRSRGRRRH